MMLDSTRYMHCAFLQPIIIMSITKLIIRFRNFFFFDGLLLEFVLKIKVLSKVIGSEQIEIFLRIAVVQNALTSKFSLQNSLA